MVKWIDALLGTSAERTKKLRRNKDQKKALQEQKENNKKIRALYRARNLEEIQLRQIRNKENKDKN